MSVLSRLTDSLLVRLLFRSVLPLLHVDNALLFSYKFQIICIAFCTEFVQCTVCSSREYACILLLHSLWRISLIWAGNFSLALDFPFKYWPLRPSTLCWAGLSILYCTTWYNISTYGCSTYDNDDGYGQFTGHYGGNFGFISDFVTHTRSYGASWYSSNLWKIVSSCPEPMSPS